MNSLFSFVFEIDKPSLEWTIPVWELFISAILGGIIALLTEHIISKSTEGEKRKEVIELLKEELSKVQSAVEVLDSDTVYIRPYSIPLWRGINESGMITCLNNKKYFIALVNTYSVIEEANLLEQQCFNLYSSSDESYEQVHSLVLESRKEVKKFVEALLKRIK